MMLKLNYPHLHEYSLSGHTELCASASQGVFAASTELCSWTSGLAAIQGYTPH